MINIKKIRGLETPRTKNFQEICEIMKVFF